MIATRPTDCVDIVLQPGDFYFGGGNTCISTLLGSCVSITIWHPRLFIGGMCHYMLPSRANKKRANALDGRYADEVMQFFLQKVLANRTKPEEYHVKLFGGGNMFPNHKKANVIDVSNRNIDMGRDLLKKHGFSIVAEDVGGEGHRKLRFELWTGDVWVKQGR